MSSLGIAGLLLKSNSRTSAVGVLVATMLGLWGMNRALEGSKVEDAESEKGGDEEL